MKSSRITTLLTTGVALAALTACGTNQTAKGVDQHAAATLARIEALRSASTPTIELTDSRQKIQDAWVAGPVNTISIVKRPPQMDAQIDINSSTSITVLGALARIKMLTGLDVQVAPDVMTKPPAPFGNLFTGTVEELLQKLCISNKLSLRYAKDKTEVTLYRYETASLRVKRKPGVLQTTTQLGVTGGGSSNGNEARSGGEMSAAIQGQAIFDPWRELTEKVKAMLSPDGKVKESPSTSDILVTDLPEVVDRIRKIVEDDNKLASTPISVKVEIISITTADDQNLGVNWNLVFATLKNGNPLATINFGSPNTFASGSYGAFSIATAPGSTSRFANSDFLIDALSKVANTKTLLRRDFTSLHNVPSGFSRTNSKTYRARVTPAPASSTSTGGTVGVEPGQINTGVRFIVTPTSLGDGEYSIELNYNDSFLREIVSLGLGSQQIDAPDVDGNQFFNVTALKLGETAIINAYEVDSTDGAVQGLTSAVTTATRSSAQKQRIYILVTVTGGIQ